MLLSWQATDMRFLAGSILLLSLGGCDNIQKIISQSQQTESRLSKLEASIAKHEMELQQRSVELIELQNKLNALAINNIRESINYDDRVLSNLRNSNSDLIAESLKEACLRNVSVVIPNIDFSDSKAYYGQLYGEITAKYGLYLNINNLTGYTITELVISITEKKTNSSNFYTVTQFQPPVGQGVLISGQPKDITKIEMLTPGMHQFTLPLVEYEARQTAFFNRYQWGVASAKGFLHW